ncbi:hypothetical protein [Nitrospira japonica]|nr:hypothetical protein [Nitrospira japonica]
MGLGAAAEAGQHFLRLLGQKSFGTRYHAAFTKHFPMAPPTAEEIATWGAAALRFLHIMAGRVPDGAALVAALRKGALPAELGIDSSHEGDVREVGRVFVLWYEQLVSEPVSRVVANSAWSSQRMEYAFSISAPLASITPPATFRETVLRAQEYPGGSLDWFHFDLAPGLSLGADGDADGKNSSPILQTVIPSPVSYSGMPETRWWEFEDATVNFGAVDSGPEDLARMLLIEFAVTYGNDWFVIPVELPIGSLSTIQSLIVSDTFGVRTLIPSIKASTHPTSPFWRMFSHSLARGTDMSTSAAGEERDLFFLAPTLRRTLEGKPVDEVLLIRDEMANMAWGIEGHAEGPSGRSVNRREAYSEKLKRREPGFQPTSQQDISAWRLATEVPDYWVPLIPVLARPNEGGIMFRRGATLRQDGSLRSDTAQGRLMNPVPGTSLDIFEEEIPREGVRLTRAYQHARWLSGSSLLWLGRRKHPGRGEGSSGLRFDVS